jgi:hypothetical protein
MYSRGPVLIEDLIETTDELRILFAFRSGDCDCEKQMPHTQTRIRDDSRRVYCELLNFYGGADSGPAGYRGL